MRTFKPSDAQIAALRDFDADVVVEKFLAAADPKRPLVSIFTIAQAIGHLLYVRQMKRQDVDALFQRSFGWTSQYTQLFKLHPDAVAFFTQVLDSREQLTLEDARMISSFPPEKHVQSAVNLLKARKRGRQRKY